MVLDFSGVVKAQLWEIYHHPTIFSGRLPTGYKTKSEDQHLEKSKIWIETRREMSL